MDVSQPATSPYTFGPRWAPWSSTSIRAGLASFAQLESVQVVCIIALGMLDFAALGVCGGETQHHRAVRIWMLMIAFGFIIVVGIVAWRFPYELIVPSRI